MPKSTLIIYLASSKHQEPVSPNDFSQYLFLQTRTTNLIMQFQYIYLKMMIKSSLKLAIVLSIFIVLTYTQSQGCPKGLVYQPATKLCKECSSIDHTVHAQISSLPENTCKCRKYYFWSKEKAKCIKDGHIKKINQKADIQQNKNINSHKKQSIQRPLSEGLSEHSQKQQVFNQKGFEQQSVFPTEDILIQSKRHLQTTTCNTTAGFIQVNNQVCLNCRDILFTAGPGAQSTYTCNCQSPNIWRSGNYFCVCGLNANNVLTNYMDYQTCKPCSSISNASIQSKCSIGDYTEFMPNGNNILCSSIPRGVSGGINMYNPCICQYGSQMIYTLGQCMSIKGISYYDGNDVILCSTLNSINKPLCQRCTGPYFYNGVFCIDASLIPLYNIATSSCQTGATIRYDIGLHPLQPYRANYVACTCNLGTYYKNGIFCSPCANFSPGGKTICQSCSASSGYFGNSLGCTYCPNLIGSTAAADPSGNGCICQTNRYWNAAAHTCDCDHWNNYVQGPYNTCIYCPNSPGTTGVATKLGGCFCITGFWNKKTFSCNGVCSIGTYKTNGVCADCSTVNYTTGAGDGTVCECLTNFVWNTTSQTCQCPNNCIFDWIQRSCTCTPPCNTTTSVLIGSTCFSCSLIPSSTGPAGDNVTCKCNAPLQWVWYNSNQTGNCICNNTFSIVDLNNNCLSCLNLPFTTGAANNNACACKTGFLWNANSSTCYCPTLYTISADNQSCFCNTITSILIGSTCFNCYQIPNSNGPNSNQTACQCISLFQWVWNASSLTGSCVCSNLSPDGTCLNCLTGFVWNSNSQTWGCPISAGFTISTDYKRCVCNTVSSAIIGSLCVNCLNIPMSTGPNPANTVCQCSPTLLWLWDASTLTGSCLTCNASFTILHPNNTCINCLNLPFATGTALNNTCLCVSNLVYDSNSVTCSCLSPLIYSNTSSSCVCPVGFYRTSNNACNCNLNIGFILPNGSCFTCANVTGSTGIRQNSYTNLCFCQKSFFWLWNEADGTGTCVCPNTTTYNSVTKSCVSIYPFGGISKNGKSTLCRNIPNSDGTVINSLTCGCFAPYSWSAATQSCICSSYNSDYYYIQRGVCTPCYYVSNYSNSNQCSSCAQQTNPLILGYDSNAGCYNCSTVPAGSPTCGCSSAAGYYLNSTTCVQCSVAFSGSNASQCSSCSQADGFLRIGDLCIYCPIIHGATGAVDLYGCSCGQQLFWNSSYFTCDCDYFNGFIALAGVRGSCFDCSTVANYQLPATPTECNCETNYVWNPSDSTCIPYVPPSALVFVGLSSPKVHSSKCDPKTSILANGKCTLCSSYSYTTGNTVNSKGQICQCIDDGLTWTTIKAFGCQCSQQGYTWDQTIKKCIKNSANN